VPAPHSEIPFGDRISTDPKFSRTRELLDGFDGVISELDEVGKATVRGALQLSLSVHIDQEDRPDGDPYVNHPLEVALTLANQFQIRDSNSLAAALLHDSVEDQAVAVIREFGGTTAGSDDLQASALSVISDNFGKRVSEMVGRLTNPNFQAMAVDAQLKGDQRKEAEIKLTLYKEHFLKIMAEDPETFLVKLADFSQNALTLGWIEEGAQKDWYRRKYGPVILATIEELRRVADEGHVLSGVKHKLIEQLTKAYDRDYKVAQR